MTGITNITLLSKQALVITAYKDLPMLKRLLGFWCGNGGWAFVHLDRKCHIAVDDLAVLGYGEKLTVFKKFRVGWGGLNHVRAVLHCLKAVAENKKISYLHIVSGQDYPLHNAVWFAEHFDHSEESFISHENKRVIDTKYLAWYELYYWPMDYRSGFLKSSLLQSLLCKVQRRLGIRRRMIGEIPISELRRCMIYGSFSCEACRYLFHWLDEHPRFLPALRFSYIPEECFFATVFYGSKWESHQECSESMIWEKRNGVPPPAVLIESDFNRLKFDRAFARKMDSQQSSELLKMIDHHLSKCRNPSSILSA